MGSVGWALPYTRVEIRRLGADGQLRAICATGEVGPRGMCVNVTLPGSARLAVPVVEQALDACLFEARVSVE